MKALTLWEPYATLVAHGFKEVETRDWYTNYRGPLAIHAAKRKPDPTDLSHVTFALGHRGLELPALKFGAVLCTCNLVACTMAPNAEYNCKKLKEWFEPKRGWDFERLFGDYSSGRWAWILRDVKLLEPPQLAHGTRKLWEWKESQP